MKKELRPLLILGAVAAYYLWRYYQDLQTQAQMTTGSTDPAILGTRTVSAISDFIAKLKPTADEVEAETGIKAALGIGQASEESNWGLSKLALPPNNNLFGMTADDGSSWATAGNPRVNMPTYEFINGVKTLVNRYFRVYGSWDESYRDWAAHMQSSLYVNAGALDALQAGDKDAFGAALVKAGYATDPKYATTVASRIQQVEDALA